MSFYIIRMAAKRLDPQTGGFPTGLSQPALRALAEAGITRLQQLTTVSEANLRRLHGMGPKGIDLLRSALAARGWSFASSNTDNLNSH